MALLFEGCGRNYMSKVIRKSNIELLRILSMFLICLHHFSVHGPWPSTGGALPHAVIDIMSMGGKAGVNCFILITGYFLVKSSFKSRSLVKLLVETFFYSLGILIVFYVIDPNAAGSVNLLKYLLPTSSGLYWFMTNYVALYILSPVINRLLSCLSNSSFGLVVTMGFVLFSVLPTVTTFNPIASNFVWFVYVYSLGAYMRRMKDASTELESGSWLNPVLFVKRVGPAICVLVAVVFLAASVVAITYANYYVDGYEGAPRFFMAQNSAVQVVLSLGLFMLFEKMSVRSNRFVNTVAGATLGVYLIHDNPLVRGWLWPHFDWAFGRDIVLMLAVGLAAASAVFLICAVVDIVRRYLVERPTMALLEKTAGPLFDRIDRVMGDL